MGNIIGCEDQESLLIDNEENMDKFTNNPSFQEVSSSLTRIIDLEVSVPSKIPTVANKRITQSSQNRTCGRIDI